MDLQKVKAVLFDLDGTLLDTVQDIGTCINDVMCRYGFPTHDLSVFPSFIGHGRTELLRAAVPEGTDETLVKQISDEYAEHYCNNCARFTAYYPGSQEILNELEKRGYLLGIITNKTQKTADEIISKCGWSPFEGTTFKWAVEQTWSNGECVYKNGKINDEVRGKALRFDR
jgi:phosphoglycolate phosphatase